MNRALSVLPLRVRVLSQSVRHGSGGPVQFGKRWVTLVRGESNVVTVDDPPTAPLHEMHELGHGKADFSNFVDKNEDVSTGQAVGGLGFILGVSYAIYRYATYRAANNTPAFTLREFPEVEKDIPTWQGAKKVTR